MLNKKQKSMKTEKQYSGRDLLAYMDSRCKMLEKNRRSGTAGIYRSTRNRLKSFINSSSLPFKEVTLRFMRDFESSMRLANLSPNSQCTYLSCLRTVYNSAVSDRLAPKDSNPFSHIRFSPKRTDKATIDVDALKKIALCDLDGEGELSFARDLFIFSFMTCGIPFVDLAYLTSANLVDGFLVYYRRKTNIRISIRLSKGMSALLNKYSGKGVGDYLFPILKKADPSYTEYKSSLRTYNRRLCRIRERLKLAVKLTSYVARHAWAMEAKRLHTPLGIIGESLGHTSEKTTRFYLSSLDQMVLDKANMQVIRSLDNIVRRSR